MLNRIQQHLLTATARSQPVSAADQLCICLNFLGTNGQYHLIGRANGPSKASVCRIVRRVVRAVNYEIFPVEVQWPMGNELGQVPRRFYSMANMPAVCGCIDGTLIPILAPSQNEPQFVDRHGQHSINCMMVAGPEYRFYYCSANWPGSVNDCRVLNNSSLFRKFSQGWKPFENAVLLGDSIYPCKEWLVPPITQAVLKSEEERAFNSAQMATRRMVESSFGILKNKFPCLNYLRVKSAKFACEIIKACVSLHNVALRYRPPTIAELATLPPILNAMGLEDSEANDEREEEEQNNMQSTHAGKNRRQQLVTR